MTRTDRILGTVKRCPRCGEWWPLDQTFFYMSNPAWCRACFVEYHQHRKGHK